MTVVKVRPTSPGRRFVTKVIGQNLYKGEAHAPLLINKNKTGGRNHI